MRKHVIGALMTIAASVTCNTALSEPSDYRQRAVTIVIGFPPGTATDQFTRIIAERLSERMGQSFIVENRTGQGGSIGAAYVTRAEPDGYTLLVSGSGPMVISPALNKATQYDATRDFAPVGMTVRAPYMLVASPKLGLSDLPGLAEHARGSPAGITYASTGVGTTSHLLTAMLAHRMGLNMLHVPYRGTVQAMTDVASGNVDVLLDPATSLAPHAASGKVVPLAVTSPQRMKQYPDIPTVSEQGYPGFEGSAWLGMFAPAGTPRPIVTALSRQLQEVMNEPKVVDAMDNLGYEVSATSAERYIEILEADKKMWAEAIRISGAIAN